MARPFKTVGGEGKGKGNGRDTHTDKDKGLGLGVKKQATKTSILRSLFSANAVMPQC